MNKVKRYIEASHTCFKNKAKVYEKLTNIQQNTSRLCPYARFIDRHQNDATSFQRISLIISYNL